MELGFDKFWKALGLQIYKYFIKTTIRLLSWLKY